MERIEIAGHKAALLFENLPPLYGKLTCNLMVEFLKSTVKGRQSLLWSLGMQFQPSKWDRFGWTSLRLVADATACTDCKLCSKNCPISLDVNGVVQLEQMEHSE